MSTIARFVFRRRGGRGWHWTDVVTWIWLIGGLLVMFGPAVWLVGSSFKTPAALAEFPPTILPYASKTATVEGYDKPLALYEVAQPDGSTKVLAEVRRIGTVSQMVDPANPGEIVKVNIADRSPVRTLSFATSNYTEPFTHFDFLRYLWNSVFVTVMATLITLVVNSMAAFALSKYEFRGRHLAMLVILATLRRTASAAPAGSMPTPGTPGRHGGAMSPGRCSTWTCATTAATAARRTSSWWTVQLRSASGTSGICARCSSGMRRTWPTMPSGGVTT